MDDDPEDTLTALAERRGENLEVYQAAEDSAILAGEVVRDLEGTMPSAVLDVGTGSGYIGARVSRQIETRVVGVDVNPDACRAARAVGVEAVVGDLVAPFADGVFDSVVFNPPYLPASEEAAWDDWFEVAVTGGETGRELLYRFLRKVGRVLTSTGVVYLLASSLTGVDEIVEIALEEGYNALALTDVSFPGETLTVLKLVQ